MRRWMCVPMIALCLLAGCSTAEKETVDLREQYCDMVACEMEAEVTCEQAGAEWSGTLACTYVHGGESVVEVLAPAHIAGVRAAVRDTDWQLEYGEVCLDAGPLSREEVSPALCLPRLMNALRDGWLLEENEETWGEEPCLRLCVDQTGLRDGKIISTVWLRRSDGAPVRGEVSVDGEKILTAEFTRFAFCDTITK